MVVLGLGHCSMLHHHLAASSLLSVSDGGSTLRTDVASAARLAFSLIYRLSAHRWR